MAPARGPQPVGRKTLQLAPVAGGGFERRGPSAISVQTRQGMPAMTRLLLIALGTRGDVQPAIALGCGLRDAGHGVALLAGDDFAEWVGAHGLAFVPSGIDMQALMRSPDGIAWAHARSPFEEIRRMRVLFQRFGPDSGRTILATAEEADALVGAFTADAFGMAVAEKLGKPYFTTALQPLHPTRSGAATLQPIFAGRESVLNRWSGRLTEWLLFGVFEPAVHAWRRELGLAPCTRRGYFDQLHAVPTLCGFSPHAVPRPRDWPDHKLVTGYWFLDDAVGWAPPNDLVDFLAAGPPPVYVGFGSMSDPDGAATGGLILRALRRQGLRAVLAQGWAGLGVASEPGRGALPPTTCTSCRPRRTPGCSRGWRGSCTMAGPARRRRRSGLACRSS